MRVALTGGIASGKSTCLGRFAALGAPILDADVVARDVVAPDTPGLETVVARFGDGVLTRDGRLDREALGRLVFADARARRELEAIVHPAVYEAVRRWFADLEATARAGGQPGPARPGVADIPLLYETRHEGDFDRVVVAACRPDQQLARLMARDGLDEAAARQRIDAQWPLADKARLADFVIDTSGTLEETYAQVDEVWTGLNREIGESGNRGIGESD